MKKIIQNIAIFLIVLIGVLAIANKEQAIGYTLLIISIVLHMSQKN